MDPRDARNVLRQRLEGVRRRISAACARVGRAPAEVTLVAVTKTVTADFAALLVELGVLDLGENRPQELWRKAQLLPANTRWHLIGHLQRNKIAPTLPLVQWIHSVDSARLLEALDREAVKLKQPTPILLEFNTSGEASKGGFAPAEIDRLAEQLRGLQALQPRGLMTMAALQDPEACRPGFVQLRTLRDRLQQQLPGHRLDQLSMGMSNDFEVAIEEGATFIRLGTVLFEGLA